MLTKQLISFFVLSTLIVLPAETVLAGEVKVENNNARVTIKNGVVKIQTSPGNRTIISNPRGITKRQYRIFTNSRSKLSPQCKRGQYNHTITRTSRSGTSINRTYSSTITCN